MIFSFSLYANPNTALDLPWLTGPLIAPPGVVVPKGHFSIQPSISYLANSSVYNRHWQSQSLPHFYNVLFETQLLVGLTPWMDFQTTPLVVYNATQHVSSTQIGDLPLGFDFQLLDADAYPWIPGIKLQVLEMFPTGHYQKLNPKKLKTDLSGLGSFYTATNLIFYKIYPIDAFHYLSMTCSLGYNVLTPVKVRGFNAYGGDDATRGKVYPGNTFSAIVSFEYTLNQNWVLALDNVYNHTNKNRFSGNPGHPVNSSSPQASSITPNSASPKIGGPSTEQFSLAPAIEYNFNAHFGFIGGMWFCVAGRNSPKFRSGILSCIYYY